MPGQLLRLSDRLLNTPLLIHPAKAQIILGVLSGRIGLDASLFAAAEQRGDADARQARLRPEHGDDPPVGNELGQARRRD